MLEEDVGSARQMLESLPVVGIDLDKVTQQLEDEGVAKFTKSYESLMEALSERHPTGVR
jgi:transaldolase